MIGVSANLHGYPEIAELRAKQFVELFLPRARNSHCSNSKAPAPQSMAEEKQTPLLSNAEGCIGRFGS